MSVEAAKITIAVDATGADTATRQLGSLDDQIGSVDSSLGKLASSAGAVLAANALVKFAQETTAAFAEAQAASLRLEKVAQMKGLDGASARVMKLAAAMQDLTGADADATAQISAELLAQGKSEAMVQKMIKAAANLSAVTGNSLASSVEQLNGSLGGMARELGRSNPEIAALTEEQLRAGAAIDIITEKYAGMADSMSGTLAVTTKIREEYAGDFQEAIGQVAAPAMNALNAALIEAYKIGMQAIGFFDSLPGPVKAGAGALVAMGVAVPILATALQALGPVITIVKTAMMGLAGPAGIVVGVVSILVAATAAIVTASQEAQKAAIAPAKTYETWGKTTTYAAESVAALTAAINENKSALAEQQKRVESIKKTNNLGTNDVEAYKKATEAQRYYFDLVTSTTATIARQEQQLADLRKKNAPALSDAQKQAIADEKARQQSVNNLLASLQTEFETYGLTSKALVEYNLRKKGATQAEIAQALALQSVIDSQKEMTKAQDEAKEKAKSAAKEAENADEARKKSITDLLASLQEEAETYGLNSAALLEYTLRKKGATEAEIAQAKALQASLAAQQSAAAPYKDLLDSLAKAQPYLDAASSALGSIQQLVQSIGDTQIMQAEELLAKNKDVWDEKIAQAQAEGATTEELAALKQKATEDIASQEAALEAKRKQVQHDNAVLSKSIALVVAAVNAPAAIIKALADGGVPLAVAVGIATAAQIAAIAATPIPAAQFGGDFIVPPGSTGDSGLLRVNSGEQVSVTPARGSDSGNGKTMILSIGGREFDAYMEEQVGNAMNSGRVTVRRSGVVRA